MRFARWLLERCGSRDPEEILADLQEERRHRRSRGVSRLRNSLWWAAEVVTVCAYEIRDRRLGRRLGSGGRLRPGVAFRLALRAARRQPVVALAAAATLAVGFGAAAAIFSVFVGFGRPLPVPDGDRVVQVRILTPDGPRTMVDAELLRTWGRDPRSLTALGGFRTRSAVLSGVGIDPARVAAAEVTPEALRLLRTRPMHGRLPTADEDAVVLGHRPWSEWLDADPAVIGRALRIDGRPRTVAAVMPEGFGFPYNQELWIPLGTQATGRLEVVGRLADGAGTARAENELQGRLYTWRESAGEAADGIVPRVRVVGFTEERGEGDETTALAALLILVLALVLVSCSNVANLLLVRAASRSRSLAVQAAIGAPAGQVALQLLAEALVIALAGAALGLGLAQGAVRYIEGTLSGHWGYWWMEVSMRPSVVLFTFALALATALLSGGLPALRLRGADLTEPLKRDAAGVRGGAGRLSRALLVGQVALSCSALVVTALMARGLLGSRQVHESFPAASVWVASLPLDGDAYDRPGARRRLRRGLLEEVADDAAVRSVALSSGLPGLYTAYGPLEVEGRPVAEGVRPPRVAALAVSPQFFDVFGIRTLRGRVFSAVEPGARGPVAVVSEDFVARHLGGDDPIGRRIRVRGVVDDGGWAQVVGVVSDVVIYDVREQTRADWVYLPLEQVDPRSLYVTFRSAGDSAAAVAAVRGALRGLDPGLPLGRMMGGEPVTRIADVLAYVRRLFVTVGVLAGLGGLAAVLVAMIGLYGALSFDVQKRVPEIGVRMALGANRGRVLRAVLGDGLVRLAPGLALGLGAAWLAGPLFGIFLMGAPARDPLVYTAALAGYLLVALAATLPPARRAADLDPARVLGSE